MRDYNERKVERREAEAVLQEKVFPVLWRRLSREVFCILWRFTRPAWIKPQVTLSELRAGPALSRRSNQKPPEVSADLDFAVIILGDSHGLHWKGKLPTLVVTEGILEAPNLPSVHIKMLDK